MYRQKRKERKQQRKLERQAQADDGVEWTGKKRLRRSAEPSSLRLVIDCSFDNLMLLKVSNIWSSNNFSERYLSTSSAHFHNAI